MGVWISIRHLSIIGAASALLACGGQGESTTEVESPTVATVTRCTAVNPLLVSDIISTDLITAAQTSIRFKTEAQYVAGQSSAIIASLVNQDSQELHFRWQQLEGPTLELVNQNSPILAFDIPAAGSYRFSVHITGTSRDVTGEISINADAASTGVLNIRQDHQVVEGNNVSLRLGQKTGLNESNIGWCIAEGPDVAIDISDPFRPLFSAPAVSQDTLVRLQASANINGALLTDDTYVLTTASPAISSSYFDTPVARTHAYRENSPYADVLASCTYSNQLKEACNINQLPLIGQESNPPELEAILNRVLVSHDWMGDNFAAFLTQMDPNSDFANLLQSVSAVVISYDIRPSFYWVVTGAIYLDPNDLWLTPMQRDTINEAPDYRTGFGNELHFMVPWRYVKNNQYASQSFPITTRASRSLAQINADLASLLYHELAHANDYFPRNVHGSLIGPTLLDDYNRRSASQSLISDQVNLQYPLMSSEMTALAEVSFLGRSANATQKAYQASDVSVFFSSDIANDFYAYSSSREDTAMLFEEAMMSHRYQILRDVAITNAPEFITSDTVIVDWGQRGRIGDNSLQDRAALVIDGILPELDGQSVIANLPEPIAMRQGQSWRVNLGISPSNRQTKIAVNNAPLKPWATSNSATEPDIHLSGDRHKRPQH